MSLTYGVKQTISYDMANKDFITVDVGTTSTPIILSIPVFKNNYQFKFLNEGVGAYVGENISYSDIYSNIWKNGPNVITIFIQDAMAIPVEQFINSSGNKEYRVIPELSSGTKEKIWGAYNDYFLTNANLQIIGNYNYSGSYYYYISSSQASTTRLTVSSQSIYTGNENSGTLANFFKRPTDEELNPTNLENLAQGNYPYLSQGVVSDLTLNRWVGQFEQLFCSRGSERTPSFPSFSLTEGLFIDCVGLDNEYFEIQSPTAATEYNCSVPKFYEPIDYYLLTTSSAGSTYNAYNALYRRVYFGVQPFNYTPGA